MQFISFEIFIFTYFPINDHWLLELDVEFDVAIFPAKNCKDVVTDEVKLGAVEVEEDEDDDVDVVAVKKCDDELLLDLE